MRGLAAAWCQVEAAHLTRRLGSIVVAQPPSAACAGHQGGKLLGQRSSLGSAGLGSDISSS